jgi:hypothetical protein
LVYAIFLAYLMRFYRNKREVYYFLPGSLERAILITKGGIPMFDYNFKTRAIEEPSNSPGEFAEYQILRNMFYATTTVLEETFQKQLEEKESLEHIVFKKSRIMYHASENVRWLLIARSANQIYYQILDQITNKLEKLFQDEFRSIDKGFVPSDEFKQTVLNEFQKIM